MYIVTSAYIYVLYETNLEAIDKGLIQEWGANSVTNSIFVGNYSAALNLRVFDTTVSDNEDLLTYSFYNNTRN